MVLSGATRPDATHRLALSRPPSPGIADFRRGWDCRLNGLLIPAVESVPYRTRHSRRVSDSLVITHPFHPLKGQSLVVLFTQRRRHGLFFVCEVDGRRRITVAQDWTDRGVAASSDRGTPSEGEERGRTRLERVLAPGVRSGPC